MESMKAAFEGFAQEVREQVQRFQSENEQQHGMLEDMKEFAAAVNWTEPWLVCLLAFEAMLLTAVLTYRKNTYLQTALFFFCAGTVKYAETINEQLHLRWTHFATQPYFDKRGVFISAVMSAPLMLIMFVVLINYLLSCVTLLVDMKKKELMVKARRQAQADSGSSKKAN